MGTLRLQFWVTDASGVQSVERSADQFTWNELTPNSSGHYNYNWYVDISYDENILFIRANDTRNNSGVLTLTVTDLEEEEYDGIIHLYVDQIAPKVMENSFQINLTIIDSKLLLEITYDLFDHAGIKSIFTYYDTWYSLEHTGWEPIFNETYNERIEKHTIYHNLTRPLADERAELQLDVEDFLGNTISLEASIIIDVAAPLFIYRSSSSYSSQEDGITIEVTDRNQYLFSIRDYGSGVKEITVEDLTNNRTFLIFDSNDDYPEYNSTHFASSFDNGYALRQDDLLEIDVRTRDFGYSTMKELKSLIITAKDFLDHEISSPITIDYRVQEPNPLVDLLIVSVLVGSPIAIVGGLILWNNYGLKEKFQDYMDKRKGIEKKEKTTVPPGLNVCSNCGNTVKIGNFCPKCGEKT